MQVDGHLPIEIKQWKVATPFIITIFLPKITIAMFSTMAIPSGTKRKGKHVTFNLDFLTMSASIQLYNVVDSYLLDRF